MADRSPSLTGTAPGRFPTRRLGLPRPGQGVRVCGQTLLVAW